MPDYFSSPNFNVEKGVFEHPGGDEQQKSFFDLMEMAGKFFTRPNDPAQKDGFPILSQAEQTARPVDSGDGKIWSSVTWIGHSTLVFERGGKRVMTDPMFSDRASPLSFAGPKRVVPPAIQPQDLPSIDVVVISHSHYDHLDLPGIKRLIAIQPDIAFIVPLGIAPILREAGVRNVTELDWWGSHDIDGIRYTATPVHHWSSRSSFDRNETLWAGFMVTYADGYQFYFAGDSGYGGDFVKTRERLGAPDFAAIPIGAYEPREFMKASHVNPTEAVAMFQDLQVPLAVAIHWGTFKLTLEPMADPPKKLHAALQDAGIAPEKFRALTHGERWDF